MKSYGLILAGGLMLASVVAHATDASNFYIGGASGITINGATGPSGDAAIGYEKNGARLEEEFAIKNDGRSTSYNLMTNGLYDFNNQTKFVPYLGAGVGYAYVDHRDSSNSMAYQGIGGLKYNLTDRVAVGVDYRYQHDFNAGDSQHTIFTGITYKFGGPEVKMVDDHQVIGTARVMEPVAPPPVVHQEVAPINNKFMVFFEFDKASLSKEAQMTLDNAVKAIQTGHKTLISVSGNTDTMGSEKYNLNLSQKRADAVKDALVKAGVPAGEITVTANGKSHLLVNTKDGVREPQNRRAEIILN